jgi:Ca-activated chloride channel family protein
MVQLRATITDGAGRYVRNLGLNDFRSLENGVDQKIKTLVTPLQPDASTSVFVLFDTSNRMYDQFDYAEDANRRLHPPSFPLQFGRHVCIQPEHRATLHPYQRPHQHPLRPAPGRRRRDDTALYHALLLTLRDASKVEGNKVIVVFSNGPDTANLLSPDQVRSVAEEEGIPIYVVSTKSQNPLSKAAFHEITKATGGKTYFAHNWEKQKQAFESIDEELNNSYLIGYYPEGHDEAAFRKIDVQIVGDAGQAYRVRARSGYRPARVRGSGAYRPGTPMNLPLPDLAEYTVAALTMTFLTGCHTSCPV